MGRVAVSMLVLGQAACAQLFGLDTTTGVPDASPPPVASFQMERLSVGATLVRSPLDLSGETATYLVADAASPGGLLRVPTTLVGNDTWTAELPEGTPAAIEFTLPDPVPFRRNFAFSSRTMLASFTAYEHPDPEPAPAAAALDIGITLPTGYATGESFQIYAVGPWARHVLTALERPALGATTIPRFTVPYDDIGFPSVVSRPLAKISTADRVLALRYVGNDLTASGEVAPFDQSAGTDLAPVTMVANPHVALDIRVEPAAVAGRLAMTSPAATTLAMSWAVFAAPAWQYVNATGPILQNAAVLETDPGTIAGMYGNPFAGLGWNTLLRWIGTRSRTYMEPTFMLPMTLSTGLQQFDEPSPSLLLDQPAGLPVLVSIDRVPLTSDGMTITLDRQKPIELSAVADRADNTYYQFNIYELVPNAATPPTALAYQIVYAVLGETPTLVVPEDVFAAGKPYTIRAYTVRGGFPTIGAGNFQNRALPYAQGYLDSGVFTVAGP